MSASDDWFPPLSRSNRSVRFGMLVASITDVNSDCFPTCALEQGKIDRRQAAAATKVRLVNPH